MRLSLSVIIPTLNEEKRLPKLLDSLMPSLDFIDEILIVDGGSKDKTWRSLLNIPRLKFTFTGKEESMEQEIMDPQLPRKTFYCFWMRI